MSRRKFIVYLVIFISFCVAVFGLGISMGGYNFLGIVCFFQAFFMIPVSVKLLWREDSNVDIKSVPEEVSRYERRFFRYSNVEDNYIQIIDGKEVYRYPGDFYKAEDDKAFLNELLVKEKCRYEECANRLKKLKEDIFLYGCYVVIGIVLAILLYCFPIKQLAVIPPEVGLLISFWGSVMIAFTLFRMYSEKDENRQNEFAALSGRKTLEARMVESSARIMKYESRLEKLKEKESEEKKFM